MIRLLYRFGWPYRRLLAIVLTLVTVQAITNLYLPNLNADIINNGVLKGDTNYIVRTGVLMLFITLLLGICSIVAVYFGAKTSMSMGRDIRSAIFRKVMSFSQRRRIHSGRRL
jgi:ATP-binding cassette subfamily B protein